MLGHLGAFIVPFPVFYFYSRLGRVWGMLFFVSALVIGAVALRLMHSSLPLIFFLVLGGLGVILSETLRRNLSIERTVTVASAIMLVLTVLVLISYGIQSGNGPMLLVKEYIVGVVHQNIELYARTGAPQDQVEMVRGSEPLIAGMLYVLLPSISVTGTVCVVWINILMGRVLFLRRGMWYPDFGDLALWKIPDKSIWVAIAAALCLFVPWYALKMIGFNVLIIILFVYMLQGFAVISFLFKSKQIPFLLRVVGYSFILVQQLLLLAVAALGLVDVWFDFRKLNGKQKNS